MKLLPLLLLFPMTACVAPRESVRPVGTASKSSDFKDYSFQRLGLLLPEGEGIDPDFRRTLRDALASELAAATSFEIVPLGEADMEAVSRLDPARTGRISPKSVLELARRTSLDGLFTTRILELRPYAPVRLVLSMDLIAVETGLVTWSGSVRIDTSDRATLAAIKSWHAAVRDGNDTERALDLLSPTRIAEFAALQAGLIL
ncbi:MAG: hypothetical protein ACKVXR_12510 [Planctomycetota bacterium]